MKQCNKPGTHCDCKLDTCILEENAERELHHMQLLQICIQKNIFSKVVKSFRTVAAQTDNNIAINIHVLNNKKVHPEDI